MNRLTPGEEKIMLVLWKLKKAMVKDILPELEDKTVSHNTVSTVVRTLEQKKFIKHYHKISHNKIFLIKYIQNLKIL